MNNNGIYICYSRKDLAFVSSLLVYLNRDGLNYYDSNNSINVGDNIVESLHNMIDKCTDFIIVITRNSLSSDFIKKEFDYALQNNKHIVPIIQQDVYRDDFKKRDDKYQKYFIDRYCLIVDGDTLSNEEYIKLKGGLNIISIAKEKNELVERKKESKKTIDDIVRGLKTDRIKREHTRVQWWYWMCVVLFIGLIGGFAYFMRWNVTSINQDSSWQVILIRVLISMSFLSMIFILMNQAARSRKNLVLLSKEIQEYDYIGALLKGKVDYSTNEEETKKAIDKTFDQMIELHLAIQKQRLEKEDHTEVKDITPDVLNFFKENTSTMMGNYNEMQKNILDLHKTIVQTLKDKENK